MSEGIPPVIRPSSAENTSVLAAEVREGISEGVLTVAAPPVVQSVQVGSHKPADTTVSNVMVTPIPVQRNIFEMAFAKKLAESQTRSQAQPELQEKPTPLTPKRPQLPPLRLMNPITEPVSVYPTQQPPLSPILRSQGGAVRTCRLPILSPLRTPTPTRAPRPVMQLHAAGSPIVSPPWKEVTQLSNREQIISPPQTIPISPVTTHPSGALGSPIRAPQPTSLAPQVHSGAAVSMSTTAPQPVQTAPLTTTAPQPEQAIPPPELQTSPPPKVSTPTGPPITHPPVTHPPVTHPPVTCLPVATDLGMKQTSDTPISAVEKAKSELERKASEPEIGPVLVSPPKIPLKQLHVAAENSPLSSPPSIGSSPFNKVDLSPSSSSEHEPVSPNQPADFGEPVAPDTLEMETGVTSEASELHVGKPSNHEEGDGLKTVTQVEHSPPKIEEEAEMSTISPESCRLSPEVPRLSPVVTQLSPEVPRLSPVVPRLSPVAIKEAISPATEEKVHDFKVSEQGESSEESDESEDEESSGSEVEPQEGGEIGEHEVIAGEQEVVGKGGKQEKEEEMGMEVDDIPLVVSWPRHTVPSLKVPLKEQEVQTPTLVTKAEMKSDLVVPRGLSITSGTHPPL